MRRFQYLIFAFVLFSQNSHATDFTYEDIEKMVKANHLRRIEDLLGKLPSPLLKNFTLVYGSRSVQEASPLLPRVILFGEDSRLLIAFNDGPFVRGRDDLEIIQFRDESRSFEFHEIEFPSDSNGLKTARFSEKNPSLCLGCHGSDPRPDMDPYDQWTGFYGSQNDVLGVGNQVELENFRLFLDGNFKFGRYKFLKRDRQSNYWPFAIPNNLDMKLRPNGRFTEKVSRLNAKRLARIIEADPTYKNSWLAIWKSRLCQKPADVAFFGRFLIKMGMTPGIGLTSFNQISDSYNYSLATGQILEFVENELFNDMSREHQQFRKYYRQIGVRESYSPDLQEKKSVDDLGGILDVDLAQGVCPKLVLK